jgi:hypothetical protein
VVLCSKPLEKNSKKFFFWVFIPVLNPLFEGQNIFKYRQIIGQDQINFAIEMILNHNGSSKSYRDVDEHSKIIQKSLSTY